MEGFSSKGRGGGGRVLLEGGSVARGRERTPVVGDCGACETRRDGKKMRNGETRGEIERGRICMSHEGIKVLASLKVLNHHSFSLINQH